MKYYLSLFHCSFVSCVSLLTLAVAANAQINWDGGGDPNTSGNWTTATNWAGDVVPGTTSIAGLVDVTSGTRVVTIGTGEFVTINRLTFTQSTAGATNVLSIASGSGLNITAGNPVIGAITGGTARIDLAGTLTMSGSSASAASINTGLELSNQAKVVYPGNSTGVIALNGLVNVNAGSGGAAQFLNSAASTMRFRSSSVLNINSGALEIASQFTTAGVAATLSGTTTIASGASLKLLTPTSGSGSAGVALTNSGALTQAGAVTLNGRGSGGTNLIANSGTWAVSGSNAVIERGVNSVPNEPTFTNTGTFKGTSTSDVIDYNNLAVPGTNIVFTNSNLIQAGNGTGGSGLSSVGTLAMTDFATTLTSTSILEFDLGGLTSGEYDVLTLSSGSINLDGTLSLTLVNSFTPTTGFSLDIITGDSTINGSFATLLVNGLADSQYSFSTLNGIGTLTYTAVPEPQTWGLLVASGICLMWGARRKRAFRC